MDYEFYLNKFEKAANQLNKALLNNKQLEAGVGIFNDAVFLKLYKKDWTNNSEDPMNATTRIFFSIWITDKALRDKKILYDIHALKLRLLKGYSISSRAFAASFRKQFKKFEHKWENVSVQFGPLTLMEGWKKANAENIESIIINLANNFTEIDYLIDETLKAFKR